MKFSFVAFGLLVLVGCIVVPIPIPVPAVSGPAAVLPSGQVDSFGAALNAERAKAGVHPVSLNPALVAAATAHAADMAAQGYFDHRGKDGRSHAARIRAQGFTPCASAENIAMGQKSEAEALTSWMESSGHRSNNLSPSVNEYGLGHSGNIWVLNLGRRC